MASQISMRPMENLKMASGEFSFVRVVGIYLVMPSIAIGADADWASLDFYFETDFSVSRARRAIVSRTFRRDSSD